MIYVNLYECKDKDNRGNTAYMTLFYGDESEKLEKEFKAEEKKEREDLRPLYLSLRWLANNNFIPVSENFFYKK